MLSDITFSGNIDVGSIGVSVLILIGLLTTYFRLKIEGMQREARTTDRLNAQTKRIEDCIHKVPGHPENADASGQNTP